MLEKLGHLVCLRRFVGRDDRKIRATRSGTGPVGSRCSKKSSNSIGNGPRGREMLEKIEQLDRERAPWTRDARKNRATRSGTCPVDPRCSKNSSNSIGNVPRGREMLEKIEQLDRERAPWTRDARKNRATRSGTGLVDPRCSKNSGISSVYGASWTRDARKNRATRPGTGPVGPGCSKNSSISFTDGLRGSESLEKVGQLAPAPADRSIAVRALAGVARLFSARFRFASCHPLRYNEMEREHTFWWRLVR